MECSGRLYGGACVRALRQCCGVMMLMVVASNCAEHEQTIVRNSYHKQRHTVLQISAIHPHSTSVFEDDDDLAAVVKMS